MGDVKIAILCLALFFGERAFCEEPLPLSVEKFSDLAETSTWTESWPDAKPAHLVTGKIWNAAIQAALDGGGAVHLPKLSQPYYLDRPIVLKSGQALVADRDAEIRLLPHTNTCMVRNEHLVGFADQAVPDGVTPDTNIRISGGIWTTLATGVEGANGNMTGLSAKKDPVPGTHGVILLQNVRQVTVKNLTIRRCASFAVHLGNVHGFVVEGIRFEQHGRDGVHVNGPASDGLIRDVAGDTRDDIVSLCAWDWQNCAPSFGPIHHIAVEQVAGAPLEKKGADSIRLLPGVKRFRDSRTLDCPIHDVTLQKISDIREFKFYDQPNLEIGRDKDFSVELGELKNIHLQQLSFTRPGVIQVAAKVDGMHVEDVKLDFAPASNFKLVEIGPMSATYRAKANDPLTWVELFSPDRDVTVRGFQLHRVIVNGRVAPDAASIFVTVADQHINSDYPKTTPRGGRGKAQLIDSP